MAVNDISFVIPEGEIYGLIGPNGAGKTTTIRIACGLMAPTDGRVLVNGVDVHQRPDQAQRFIGYLSDFFSVYEDLLVWEYLDFFAHAYRMSAAEIPGRVREVIRQVGLESTETSLVKGLSRGMKQRLGIGRAIIHHPKVLLLDEPASGLDPKARMDLRNLLRGLSSQGTTVVISSHILPDLEGFCTSLGIMEKGRMLRSAKIEQMQQEESRFRVLQVGWLGDGAGALESRLQSDARISHLQLRAGEAEFRFAGSEQDVAALLRELVSAGVPLVSFSEVKETVEDLYVKVSHNQVM